jgi:hypothetical protein
MFASQQLPHSHPHVIWECLPAHMHCDALALAHQSQDQIHWVSKLTETAEAATDLPPQIPPAAVHYVTVPG